MKKNKIKSQNQENRIRNNYSRTIELNVRFIILKIIVIILIISLITAQTVRTIIQTRTTTNEVETTEEETTYYLVNSTELDEDGNYIQVPVPVGYTASEIEGETGVSTGFVIYEGDIDWSEIIVDYETSTASEEIAPTSLDEDNSANQEETTEEIENENDTDDANKEDDEDNEDITEYENAEEDELEDSEDNEDETVEEDSEDNADEETDEEVNTTIEEIQANVETSEASTSVESESVTASEEGIATASSSDYYLSDYYSEETASNIWDLQTSTNQYVWVPIDEEELENIYGVDSNGKYWGKLYTEYSTATNWTETNGVMSITSSTGYREPDVTKYRTNYDEDSKLSSYLNGSTKYELLTQELEENFYETIESIRKYGGFYIGRYETGNLSSTTAVVQKANSSTSSVTWYVMYEKCKELAGENTNVTTSMIWGSLWDATLRWLYDSGATTSDGTTLTTTLIWSNSTTWGNYTNSTFYYYTAYNSTSSKGSSTSLKIPTGGAEYTKVNNIYDMAGNVREWTLEGCSSNYRTRRGGFYSNYGYNYPANYRYDYTPTGSSVADGCRSYLFIR